MLKLINEILGISIFLLNLMLKCGDKLILVVKIGIQWLNFLFISKHLIFYLTTIDFNDGKKIYFNLYHHSTNLWKLLLSFGWLRLQLRNCFGVFVFKVLFPLSEFFKLLKYFQNQRFCRLKMRRPFKIILSSALIVYLPCQLH